MLRLSFNATAIKGNLTGIGNYAYQLANAILKKNECNVDFFNGHSWSPILKHAQSTSLARYKGLIRDHVPYSYEIARKMMQLAFTKGIKNADIYHEPNYLAFQTDVPTVITVHDLSWIIYPELHPKSRVRALNLNFEKSLQQAQYIITDSHYIKQQLVNTFNCPSDKVIPVHLGFNDKIKDLTPDLIELCLARHNLKQKQFLLVLGTIEPRKNIRIALDAFTSLPSNIRKAYPLVIVGMKGWLYADLEKQLKKMMDDDEIKVLGYLPEQEVNALLNASKMLIFPSIYEGFGLPPLEAMACATPVIGSNASSIPEVIGQAGILLDPNDSSGFKESIVRLIDDDTLYRDLASLSLARSRLFSWEKCASETIHVYKKMNASC